MRTASTWDFLEHFRWVPPADGDAPWSGRTWDGAVSLEDALRARFAAALAPLDDVLAASDRRFARFDGDPCRHDWRGFRPLCLGGETDWSDWLAYLLASSRTGLLADAMFGGGAQARAAPAEVRREWVLPGGYRADLGVRWRDGTWAHVEVKIGDEDFPKTFGTGAAMRERLGPDGARVRDFILLPKASRDAWTAAALGVRGRFDFDVAAIDWSSVAVGLRRALASAREAPTWDAWAYGFCGVLEQRLLGIPRVAGGAREVAAPIHRLEALTTLIDVVRKGSCDDGVGE